MTSPTFPAQTRTDKCPRSSCPVSSLSSPPPPLLLGSPISLPPKEFPKLRILDVSFCQISDWSQLQAFGRLPALKELVLDGNPLSSLPAPAPDTFLELQRLSLGSTG